MGNIVGRDFSLAEVHGDDVKACPAAVSRGCLLRPGIRRRSRLHLQLHTLNSLRVLRDARIVWSSIGLRWIAGIVVWQHYGSDITFTECRLDQVVH